LQINQITFTRFVAALTVIFFHYGNQAFPLTIPFLEPVFKAGPIAVNYFYLLSGFIMAIAYFAPGHPEKFSRKKYWLARFARIYPVYLVALLLVAAAQFRQEGAGEAMFLNLTMLQAWIPGYPLTLNAPGWSLSVEAFFYICFPFLLVIIYKTGLRKIAIPALVFWLATQVIHTLLLNSAYYQPMNHVHDFIYYNPLMHLNAFILGILAGVIFKKQGGAVQRLAAYSAPGIIVTSLLLALLLASREQLSSLLGFKIDFTNGQIAPLFLLFIFFLALDKGIIARIFSNKWLVLLGEASFSLYILQRPVHGIYEKLIGNRVDLSEQAHFYLYLVFLIIVSILSFKLFETPVRKYIRARFSQAALKRLTE
jgi:peptidoglycan/LPS O-acetylase OafA/YrhL